MRILSLLLPHFSLLSEALREPDVRHRPTIVTRSCGSQKLVLDYSPGLDGLQQDMPLQQALSRHGQAELLSADMPYYRSVFTELLDAMEGVSPLVEGSELGLVHISIEGLHYIYPDDEALVASVFRLVPEPFVPQAGIAGNKFLAYLTARSCPSGSWRALTEPAEDFLRNITCDVLPVSMKSKKKLHRFGLHTLGRIASLSSGPLLSQFGREGKKIYDLARGCDDTPLYPRKMEEVIEESVTLSSVTISIESILVALEVLLRRVFDRIGRAGLGIRRLAVWTRTWNEEQWEKTVWFKEPAMNIKTAVNRIRRVIEANPQPGPVEQTGLIITHLGYPGGRQVSLFREERRQDHVIEDIRQLELRLGSPQVYQVKEVEPWSRIPERRYVLVPPANP